jgi:ATP-binding cassette, subfamily B, bacterial
MATTRHTDLALLRRLLQQARPYGWQLVGFFLLNLMATPLTLLSPLPLKIAVDSVVGKQPLPDFLSMLLPSGMTRSGHALLLFTATFLVVIALISQIQALASSLLRSYVAEKLVLGFQSQLLRHAQRLSLAFHDVRGTADSIYRIQNDAASIQYLTIDGVLPFFAQSVTLVSIISVMLRLDWQLALVALAVSPILFLVARSYRIGLRRQYRRVKELESSTLSVIQEVLTAVRVVKAFGQEEREQERFHHRSSERIGARIRLTLAEGGLGLATSLTAASGTAAVLLIGISHVQAHTLTLGEMLLVMSYLGQLYGPRKIAGLQSQLASAERAFSLLDEAPDVIERPNARPLTRASGTIALQNVSFAYEEGHLVLRDITFEVAPGTRVGIAGMTGAGKTTLMSLLTRFYDPIEGRILLDGVDLRDYRLADLRNQFAIVLQEPVLFSTSIAENIAYARPDASEQEIIEAAKAANAHEFINGLPHGYQTRVGERGMRLSGGERQRIGLARAFLKDAPILLLDEPTSSVDTKTEAGIMEAMERLMCGRTTFMIAHRLRTLDHCDMRLQIEHGRVVDVTRDHERHVLVSGTGARRRS